MKASFEKIKTLIKQIKHHIELSKSLNKF